MALDPSQGNPGSVGLWSSLCWYGSIWNHADLVLDACETAVELAPDDIGAYNSRGLARALTGDIEGAIKDFEYVSMHSWFDRTPWVEALAAGQDPNVIFDAATLERWRNE